MKCALPFFSSRLFNLCWSRICIPLCSKLWYCEVEVFFLPSSLVELLRIYLQLFLRQHFSHSLQKKPAIYSLVCLARSLLLTTCSFIVQTSQQFDNFFWTEWPEDHKNRCLSSSTNSVRPHFRERVEKTKENATETKIAVSYTHLTLPTNREV